MLLFSTSLLVAKQLEGNDKTPECAVSALGCCSPNLNTVLKPHSKFCLCQELNNEIESILQVKCTKRWKAMFDLKGKSQVLVPSFLDFRAPL